MAIHAEVGPSEAADRLAIRELFDAYAHCADRRDADGQKALFIVDTRFAVYMDGEGTEPSPRGCRRACLGGFPGWSGNAGNRHLSSRCLRSG